tara:strand:+ start:159 stop:338 length:180 start_codon:yes stop_codon:yes gene_type:complete
MATIDLTEGTKVQKSDERIKLEEISKALMKLAGNNVGSMYNSNMIILLCNQINEVAKEI